MTDATAAEPDPEPLARLGQWYMDAQARLAKDDVEGAIRILSSAQSAAAVQGDEARHWHARILARLGDLYLLRRRYEASAREYRAAVELFGPDDPRRLLAGAMLAKVCVATGEFSEAEKRVKNLKEAVNTGVGLGEGLAPAIREHLGGAEADLAFGMGEYAFARELYRKLQREFPALAYAYEYNAGICSMLLADAFASRRDASRDELDRELETAAQHFAGAISHGPLLEELRLGGLMLPLVRYKAQLTAGTGAEPELLREVAATIEAPVEASWVVTTASRFEKYALLLKIGIELADAAMTDRARRKLTELSADDEYAALQKFDVAARWKFRGPMQSFNVPDGEAEAPIRRARRVERLAATAGAFLVILLVAGFAAASSSVVCHVANAAGQPISGAVCAATFPSGGSYQATTDSAGQASFAVAPADEGSQGELRVSKAGCSSQVIIILTIPDGSVHASANLTCP